MEFPLLGSISICPKSTYQADRNHLRPDPGAFAGIWVSTSTISDNHRTITLAPPYFYHSRPVAKQIPLQSHSENVLSVTFRLGPYECQATVLDPATLKATFWGAPIVVAR